MNSIQYVPVESLTPTPENWKLYNRPTIDDPSFCELVDSVSEEGVKEPLTISEDNFILSGHRRHAAAEMLGVREVPTIVHPIMIGPMSSGERVKILVEHNRGARVKTDSERIRESLAQVDPDEAVMLAEARSAQVFTKLKTSQFEEVVGDAKLRRTDPQGHRRDMLEAVIQILKSLQEEGMLPISSRSIHYQLLGRKVMTSDTKRGHVYGAKQGDSSLLSKLLTDARSGELIDDGLITDTTRSNWQYSPSGGFEDYVRWCVENLIGHYSIPMHRDQPCHVEIIVEKNTLFDLLQRKVADELRLPITAARGYPSYPVGCAIRDRFQRSGKDDLVIVYASDHDPEGYDMPRAFEKYFSHDHGITSRVVRAAVTEAQIVDYELPPDADAKPSSPRFKKYVKETGLKHAWELDSMPPKVLVEQVKQACLSVMDEDTLNMDLAEERRLNIKSARMETSMKPYLLDRLEAVLVEEMEGDYGP